MHAAVACRSLCALRRARRCPCLTRGGRAAGRARTISSAMQRATAAQAARSCRGVWGRQAESSRSRSLVTAAVGDQRRCGGTAARRPRRQAQQLQNAGQLKPADACLRVWVVLCSAAPGNAIRRLQTHSTPAPLAGPHAGGAQCQLLGAGRAAGGGTPGALWPPPGRAGAPSHLCGAGFQAREGLVEGWGAQCVASLGRAPGRQWWALAQARHAEQAQARS